MTILDRVNEARRSLRRALVLAAMFEAIAGALGVVLAFGIVDALFGIPSIGRMLAAPLALLAAVALPLVPVLAVAVLPVLAVAVVVA